MKTFFQALIILIINILNIQAKVTVTNNNVDFSITAPKDSLTKVQVVYKTNLSNILFDTINLENNNTDIWKKSVIISPGFYYYKVLLDGAPIFDPDSWTYFGCGTWIGGFNVNDSSNSFYEQKLVPFGNVNTNYYQSNIVDNCRKIYVYTPAEYDYHPEKNYPVLYLLHDIDEDESAWLYQGVFNNILDNYINAGSINPMIVVLGNINAYKKENGNYVLPNYIDSLISTELVPYIDKHYHTINSPNSRAIAGCSFGGKLAMDISLKHKNLFGNLGIFSLPGDFTSNSNLIDSINSAEFSLFFLGAGNKDTSYTKVNSFHESLKTSGITHTWDVENGSYNWLAWRKNLFAMLKELFR